MGINLQQNGLMIIKNPCNPNFVRDPIIYLIQIYVINKKAYQTGLMLTLLYLLITCQALEICWFFCLWTSNKNWRAQASMSSSSFDGYGDINCNLSNHSRFIFIINLDKNGYRGVSFKIIFFSIVSSNNPSLGLLLSVDLCNTSGIANVANNIDINLSSFSQFSGGSEIFHCWYVS